MSRVLVLRDEAAGAETAAQLAALGHEPLLLPLGQIVPLMAAPPEGPFAGIVATSRNALPAIAAHFAGAAPPVLAVGQATARQMAAGGFTIAHVGEGAAADLVGPAARLAAIAGLPLLLALGRVRTVALEDGLLAAGADFRLWETYDTRALAPSRLDAARVLGDTAPDAALLLSKTQAEGFAGLVSRAPELFRPVPRLLCLSERIAEALPAELRRFASISPRGDVSTLFAGLAEPSFKTPYALPAATGRNGTTGLVHMTNPPRRSRPKKPGETIDSTAERIGTTPIVPETADAPGQDGRNEALADPEARLADEASPAPIEPVVAGEGEPVRDDRPEETAFRAEEALPEHGQGTSEAVPAAAPDAPPFETVAATSEAERDPAEDSERRETAEAEFASAEGLDPARRPEDAREELDAETILAAAEPHHAEPPRPNLDYHETPQHGHGHGPGAGAMVGSALLGAALALLGGGLLQYAGVIPAVRQTDMQQLTQQFARQGDVQQVSTDLGAVRGDVEQLKSTLSAGGVGSGGPASADLAALTDRVGAVEGRLNNGGGGQGNAAPAIDPNVVRGATETADAARQAADAARQAAEGAQQAANGAQNRANEANQTATTASQAAGTAQQAAEVAQNAAKGAMDAANANREAIADIQNRIGTVEAANREAAVAISAAGLKAAVDRGGPFMPELESYAKAAGASPVVDALRNYAPQGVPTPAELQAAWPNTRTAMLKALNPQDPNATVGSQILSGLSGLVAVRPSGQAASGGGEGPNAAIARLDAAVSAGNLDGWNAEWQALPQAAKDASADFQRQMNARAETERVLGEALGQVVNSIGNAG